MAAIRFTTSLGAGMILTFTRNPSFPRASTAPTPAAVSVLMADGTPYREIMGEESLVTLTWPESAPMTAANYYSGAANLRGFYAITRGLPFDFRDDDGVTTRTAAFVAEPQGSDVPHGFAVTIALRVFESA